MYWLDLPVQCIIKAYVVWHHQLSISSFAFADKTKQMYFYVWCDVDLFQFYEYIHHIFVKRKEYKKIWINNNSFHFRPFSATYCGAGHKIRRQTDKSSCLWTPALPHPALCGTKCYTANKRALFTGFHLQETISKHSSTGMWCRLGQ